AFAQETDAQARTYAAGALVILSDSTRESDAWNWLLESLDQTGPTGTQDPIAISEYWERPWGAAYMLAKLKGRANAACGRLSHLRQKEDAPGWVRERLTLTLQELGCQ